MRIYAAWVLLGLTPTQVQIRQPPTPITTPALPAPTVEATDEQVLKENKIPADGPGLLEFFRRHIVQAADEDRIKTLIRQLGDDDFNRREEASLQLNAVGLPARAFLLKAASDLDAEIAHRAKECLKRLDQGTAATVVGAAVRTLAKLKPDGAAEALLAYLPAAADESLAEEVRLALAELAAGNGKADSALAVALTDHSAPSARLRRSPWAGPKLPISCRPCGGCSKTPTPPSVIERRWRWRRCGRRKLCPH